MKMVIRADDVGYTDVCNIGTFAAMENGVITAADVMLDTPGAEDALKRLRKMPWISTGWHTHFWGSPILPASDVASLYDPSTGHFRTDIQSAMDVSYEELLAECRAQMEFCISILGRPLDTGAPHMATFPDAPFARAIRTICDEYNIPYNYCYVENSIWLNDAHVKIEPDEKWKDCCCYCLDPTPAHSELHTDSLTECEKYDPAKYYMENRFHIEQFPENAVLEQSWHPGYPDWYVYRLGDQGPYARNFILPRIMDVEALTSDRLKNWIIENRIELVSMTDGLYNTSHYQEHLQEIGSPLYLQPTQ